jgi:hypothetical protein
MEKRGMVIMHGRSGISADIPVETMRGIEVMYIG